MKNARWFLFTALAVPTLAACWGDDSSDGMVDAGGGGGSGGIISTDSGAGATGGEAGAGGRAGSAGNGGSAGAPKDAANGSGGARDSGAGDSSGSGGMGGAAGRNIDAATDTTMVRDATADGTGGGRPDSGSSNDAPSPDGGAACSSGPAMGMTCTHYCSGWFSTCQPIAAWSTTYASPTACMSACAQWNETKLCCRAEHVQNAIAAPNANQTEKHCGHAVGVDAPDACL